MSRREYQQNAMGGCEEMRMEAVVCPKPRRFGLLSPSMAEPIRPLRCHVNHHAMVGDSGAGSELLDMILSKGGYGGERSSTQVASSPPFFCGSPPVRAQNPVVQDARFGTETILPFSPASPTPLSSSACKGTGPARMQFGHKPAAVRIEGFDCLGRDRGNCSISAWA
ncbi:uncharacterized protein LOC116189290 [Punica granatum]|nr:uncharacterized protein LOC116189290 [Punica granatum]